MSPVSKTSHKAISEQHKQENSIMAISGETRQNAGESKEIARSIFSMNFMLNDVDVFNIS